MRFALMAATLLVTAGAAQSASIVYSQPLVWNGNGTDVGSSWTSQVDSSVSGFRAWDNFAVSSAASVSAAVWYGLYLNNANLQNAAPNTANWVLRLALDSGGAPGALLLNTSIPAAQVSSQVIGNGIFLGNPVSVYQFTASFAGVNLLANTNYWFSPLSTAPNFDPLFTWIQGTGGDGATFQSQFSSGANVGNFSRSGDRAFSLLDAPEPSTLAAIGIGLAALAAFRRRK